jgi:hypothetical protein
MKIVITRTKSFIRSGETHTVSPTIGTVAVPDWAADTTTFNLGVQDGSIQVVQPPAAGTEPEPGPGPEAEPTPRRGPGRPPKGL